MKLIVPMHEITHLNQLIKKADGLFFGNNQFGTRLTNGYEVDDINHIIKTLSHNDKLSFLMCNQMMTDQHLDLFAAFIQTIKTDLLTGIILADIGAIMTLKSLGLGSLAIYHPETLHTNYHDFNHLKDLAIKGAFISKEITLDDIVEIGHHKSYALYMIGHGHLNMFYSKRQLIKNYATYIKTDGSYLNQKDLRIIEAERPGEIYPILEDQAGTHVFRNHVFYTTEVLNVLNGHVDILFLDTLFKDDVYTLRLIDIYKEADHAEEDIKSLQNDYQEQWDTGFLYQKTIYKKGQEEDL